jgi:hypothetical protein
LLGRHLPFDAGGAPLDGVDGPVNGDQEEQRHGDGDHHFDKGKTVFRFHWLVHPAGKRYPSCLVTMRLSEIPGWPVQATRTVTRQTFVATLVMVVVRLNWASPGWAVVCPLAKTTVGPVVPVVTALQGFMIEGLLPLQFLMQDPAARPR